MISMRLIALLLMASLPALWASWGGPPLEPILAAERQRTVAALEQALAAHRQIQSDLADGLAGLDAELLAARKRLEELRSLLVSVLASDDAGALQVVQAEIAAQQARSEAAETEKALRVKRVEEAGREVDAWKKRAATLDLAQRMEMKVLLATAADQDNREKKVDSARKEIEYQEAQVSKYRSRRDTAAARWDDLGERLARITAERPRNAANGDWVQARAEETRQLQRSRRAQEEWFLLNRLLEARSRRNLAFARLEFQVIREYAGELGRKDAARQAEEAKTLADQADTELGAARVALEPRSAAVAGELASAGREADAALAAIGRTQDAREQDSARNAYDAALESRNRWEVEGELLKEFIAFQKAVSAFAEEKAERARNAAEKKNLRELDQERRGLEESARTSVQYVQSFKTMLQKLDSQVEAARKGLGVSGDGAAPIVAAIEEQVPLLARERATAPNILFGRLAVAAEKLADESGAEGARARRPQSFAAQFVQRVAQRSLARQRLSIAEVWLEGTRQATATIDQKISNLYWEQRDPRLSWSSACEFATLTAALASDTGYAWDAYRLGLANRAGYATLWSGIGAVALLVCLVIAAALAFGRLRALSSAWGWFGTQVAVTAPLATAGYLLAFALLPGNRLARFAGLVLLVGSGWWLVRAALIARFADHRFPSVTTVGGAALAALRLSLLAGAVALVFALLGQAEESHWNVQRVLLHLWLLAAFLAGSRLALHPTLLGRFLSRRSQHVGVRLLGSCVAYACIGAAGLATSLYLLSLDNLGQTVLRTVLSSFGLLAAAVAGSAVLSWVLQRTAATKWTAVAWERLAQVAIGVLAAGVIGWLWSALLNSVLFSANAPEALQQVVQVGGDILRRILQLWHRQISGGMTVSSLCNGLVVFALSFWVSKVAKRLFLERVLARTPMDETTRVTFATVLGYLVIVFGFLTGLNVAGSSLQNLALLAGAITVGLGFGLQNVINNFVSSLLIHFGRTIRVGDYIDVGGQRGTVREIGLRNTVIFTDDGVTVLVPNGSFITANIINWTNPSRSTRLHVPVSVHRQADLAEVTQLLTAAALAHPDIVRKPAPTVEIRTTAADKISIELLAWTEKPERLITIVGELGLEADRRLRERKLVV